MENPSSRNENRTVPDSLDKHASGTLSGLPSGESAVALCPLCQCGSRLFFSKGGFEIRDCQSCFHRFFPPRERELESHVGAHYGNGYFEGGGAGYADYLREGRLVRNHGRRYGRLLARWMPPGKVLDVGSAAGFFLQGLIDSGWAGKGVEPNEKMAGYARGALDVDVTTGSFEACEIEGKFDLVSMVQVIAHFMDPRLVLEKAADHLKPEGFLLIETWNRNSWTAKGFGRLWHEYSPPTVLHWFDKTGLKGLAGSAGFEYVAGGRPIKWLDGAHAKSLLRHILVESKARYLLPSLLVVPDGLPIPYPSEDLMWMLFRKKRLPS